MSIPKLPGLPDPDSEQKAKMSKEEVVGFLNDMIDALTWKRVGLLCLFASLLITLLITFENRTFLFNKFFSSTPLEQLSTPWEISDATKAELQKLTNSQKLLAGTLVMEVNLKKNRRILKYWYVSDPTIRQYAANTAATLLPQAFFSDDRKNNDQMLAILGNEFKCVPTTDTIYMRVLPELYKSVPYLCRLAVPPYAGQFAGFATLFLTRAPTQTEADALKIELTRISVEMYLRDIDRNARK
jgi:hypothetical protein